MLGPGSIDFTPLFVYPLIIGLVIVAIGVWIWLGLPKARFFGIFIIVVGVILMLLCLIILVANPISKLIDKWQNRVSTQVLSQDREIQGVRLPRGAKVEWIGKFMSDVILAQPREVLGIPLEGEIKFGSVLESGKLASDDAIDSVPCKAHKPVEFFPASAPERDDGPANIGIGKLKHCTSSAAFDFGGNRYRADAEVTLDSSDHVELGVLAVDQYVDGHWCKQGTRVKRAGTRAIWFTLARDETVGGIACKGGTEVIVEQDGGHVMSAVLAHDQQIGGTPCRGGDAVDFDYSGSFPLDSCVIRRAVTMLGEDWPAGTKLKGLSPHHSLEVTLPRGASKMVGDIRLGDIKFVGRCRIGFDGTPPRVRVAEVLEGEPGYVELLGHRYSEVLMFDDKGRGTLSEPATIHCEACKPGDTIDFKFGKPK